MTTTISFWVPGTPKAQPRARRSINGGVYTPSVAAYWKSAVAIIAKAHANGQAFSGPVEICLTFHLPRPKRLFRKSDPQGPIPSVTSSDVDNLAKAVMDAITGTRAIWGDDNQVWRLLVERYYHAKTGQPGCHVTITGGADGN